MFSGLVETTGTVLAVTDNPPGKRLLVQAALAPPPVQSGESIAVGGCCLTATAVEADRVAFDLGPETLQRTTLGSLAPGSRVNLERALRLGDRLGGHLVTGHIDGVGTLLTRDDTGEFSRFEFEAPAALMRQMAPKGSVAVDGVSLTLVDVTGRQFSVMLVPHTLAVTTLGWLRPGQRVNLETDLLAKYVQRQLEP